MDDGKSVTYKKKKSTVLNLKFKNPILLLYKSGGVQVIQ